MKSVGEHTAILPQGPGRRYKIGVPPDPPMNRRRFFRAGLRELLKPLAQMVDTVSDVANQVAKIESLDGPPESPAQPPPVEPPQPAPTIRPPDGQTSARGRSRYGSATPDPVNEKWLRPPGAIPELQLATTCDHTGECVRACPAQCIKIEPTTAGGLPHIDVDAMPCVVCDGLYCMHACPTGALVPTSLADIDMGTAVWHEEKCLRSHGDDCSICVDECPIGNVAIELVEGKVNVIEAGCIGCGVCQNRCPTEPKSITVTRSVA